MSLTALAGFAEGFIGAKTAQRDRADRLERGKRDDALIAALGARPDAGSYPTNISGSIGGTPLSWGDSGYGSVKGSAPSGGDPGSGTFASLLDKHEGGGKYDTLFGFSQNGGRFDGVDVSKMTLAEAMEFSKPDGEYGQWVKSKIGRVATPMGRGQIVGTTLRGAVKEMGLPLDTKFDGNTQGLIIDHLAKRRLASAGSPVAKRAAMRAEWEGFKHVDDATLDGAIARFEAGSAVPVAAPEPIEAPRALGAVPPTRIGGPQ